MINRLQETVENEIGDIPGFRGDFSYKYRDQNGSVYEYDFGLSYQRKTLYLN